MASMLGNTALKGKVAPAEAPGKARSRLRLVVARRRARPSRLRPAYRVALTAATVVVVTSLVIAAAQAVVASRQIRIDDLQQQLGTAVTANENLQVQRAALTEPSRILSIAEQKLKMTTPSGVNYLVPVNPAALTTASGTSTK